MYYVSQNSNRYCAAIETPTHYADQLRKKKSRGWEPQMTELKLPCPHATSLAPLCTHKHVEGGSYVYNKTICKNHWPIRND